MAALALVRNNKRRNVSAAFFVFAWSTPNSKKTKDNQFYFKFISDRQTNNNNIKLINKIIESLISKITNRLCSL